MRLLQEYPTTPQRNNYICAKLSKFIEKKNILHQTTGLGTLLTQAESALDLLIEGRILQEIKHFNLTYFTKILVSWKSYI
jgi:hypothetical protein